MSSGRLPSNRAAQGPKLQLDFTWHSSEPRLERATFGQDSATKITGFSGGAGLNGALRVLLEFAAQSQQKGEPLDPSVGGALGAKVCENIKKTQKVPGDLTKLFGSAVMAQTVLRVKQVRGSKEICLGGGLRAENIVVGCDGVSIAEATDLRRLARALDSGIGDTLLHKLRVEWQKIRVAIARSDVSAMPSHVLDNEVIRVRSPTGKDKTLYVGHACEVEPGGILEIEGPLTLKFPEGCGIYVRGTLLINASETVPDTSRRVLMEASDLNQGWGNITLEGGNGSILRNCILANGRGAPYELEASNLTTHPTEPMPQLPKRVSRNDGIRVGGALAIINASNVQVSHCTFTENFSESGGALFVRQARDGKVLFSSCTFERNCARSRTAGRRAAPGGAVYCTIAMDLTFRDCTFQDNNAEALFGSGGAIYAGHAAVVKCVDCRFVSNRANNAGGAVYSINLLAQHKDVGTFRVPSNLDIERCVFTNNVVMRIDLPPPFRDSAGGPALPLRGLDVHVDDNAACRITKGVFSNVGSGTPLVVDDNVDDGGFDAQLRIDGARIDSPNKDGVEQLNRGRLPSPTIERPRRPRSGLVDLIPAMLPAHCCGARSKPEITTIVVHTISAGNWAVDPQIAAFLKNREVKLDSGELIKVAPREIETLPDLVGVPPWFDPRYCRAVLVALALSYHYLIDRHGLIWSLVDEKDKAFHAGQSLLKPTGQRNINTSSIGVALVAEIPEHGPRKDDHKPVFEDAQYQSLQNLIVDALSRHQIRFIVGHDEIAPRRKQDPGESFDWERIRNKDLSPRTAKRSRRS